ncbi:MAG: N-acetylmuramoyl-L-alanine amidase [Actinomycetota bacterium]|nr:N-acetylmuramoyl-L-alanine amidase [Actinomycetota bacterium]
MLAAACGGEQARTAVVGRAPTTTTPAPTTTAAPARSDAKAVVTPSGVVVPVIAYEDTGTGQWRVRTPCNRTATIADGTPVAHVDIVLDPGHGGAEPGAISPGGLREADVNLAVSQQAKAALEAAGYTVVLTRTADYELGLLPRAEIARAIQPRAFVSVHHNAEPDGPRAGPGSETFYQIASADSKRLAGLLYEEIVRALSSYDVAWVSDTDAGAKYRQGQQGDYYAMLRRPGAVVSVLTEAAFVSNPPEADLLARPDVQKVEGEALARAIVRYLTTADPGSGFTEGYPRTEPPDTSEPHVCQDPPLS